MLQTNMSKQYAFRKCSVSDRLSLITLLVIALVLDDIVSNDTFIKLIFAPQSGMLILHYTFLFLQLS